MIWFSPWKSLEYPWGKGHILNFLSHLIMVYLGTRFFSSSNTRIHDVVIYFSLSVVKSINAAIHSRAYSLNSTFPKLLVFSSLFLKSRVFCIYDRREPIDWFFFCLARWSCLSLSCSLRSRSLAKWSNKWLLLRTTNFVVLSVKILDIERPLVKGMNVSPRCVLGCHLGRIYLLFSCL